MRLKNYEVFLLQTRFFLFMFLKLEMYAVYVDLKVLLVKPMYFSYVSFVAFCRDSMVKCS